MMKRIPASAHRLMAAGLPGARPDATRRCPDIDHSPDEALLLGKVHLPGETEALGKVPRSNHDDVNAAAVECPVDIRDRRPAFRWHYYERLLPGRPGSLHRITSAPVRGGCLSGCHAAHAHRRAIFGQYARTGRRGQQSSAGARGTLCLSLCTIRER
jgi:hypothetical protein